MTRTYLSASLVLLLGAAACGGGDGAEPPTVKDRLTDTLPDLLSSTDSALTFLSETDTLASVDSTLSALDGAFANLPFTLAGDQVDPGTDGGVVVDEQVDLDGNQIAQELSETIFTDANYAGNGDYRLSGEDFCVTDGGPPDPDCVAELDSAKIVIHVEAAGDGLDFTLGVGPNRAEPITLELRSDRLTVAVDLAETKDAIAFLGSLTGETIELPQTFEGVIAASLIANAPQNVSIQLAARSDVAIDGTFDGERLAFSTAARDPLLSLDVNAAGRELGASIDVGRTQISGPWQSFAVDSNANGNLEVDWQGFSAGVTLEDGAQTLTVENIGFGDGTSTVSLDEFTLLSVDLNPSAGRAFDLSFAPSNDGLPTIGVDPEFDLTLDFDLRPLANAGDVVEDYLLDDTYRVTLNGQTPTLQPIENVGLAVRSGSLTISADSAASDITVGAGQCLLGVSDPAPGAHPVLGFLAAGACE